MLVVFAFGQFELAAQNKADNFFYIEEEISRDETPDVNAQGIWGNMTVTDYEDGTILPVGSGLWLLAAVAGLYLIIRTRKSRKTATMMAAALALTLGMTQCRKPTPVTPTPNEGETLFISFTAGNGGGAKTDVNVDNGKITWNAGDKVYVVYDGKLLGETALTATPQSDARKADITGTITTSVSIAETNPSFTFYYVGKGVAFSPTDGATNLTFNIADQNGHNGAAINDAGEYMIGRTEAVEMEQYETGKFRPRVNPTHPRAFTPMTAVIRLDTHVGFGSNVMTMNGSNTRNEMTINIGSPTTPTYNTGSISFLGGSDVQLSMFPSTADNIDADATLNFSGNSRYGKVIVKNGVKSGRIYAKISDGISCPIPLTAIPVGALPGRFSVSATKTVNFSKGNLWYDATSSLFHFEDNQYDGRNRYGVYDDYSVINGVYSKQLGATPANTMGAIFWSKYQNEAVANTYPASPTFSASDVIFTNQTSETPNPSFAVNVGGTNVSGLFRLLSFSEWNYLINRPAPGVNKTTLHFAELRNNSNAFVNYGVIILPDDWQGEFFDAPTGNSWATSATVYTLSQWQDMEEAGAVFFPALCNVVTNRPEAHGGQYYIDWSDYERRVDLWASTALEQSTSSGTIRVGYYMHFAPKYPTIVTNTYWGITSNYIQTGKTLRLVTDAGAR